ncbi:TPA: hypothetical protein ACX6SK_002413 [Photobacterium damselae]
MAKTMTLAAKVDALRAKGFSDEEIENLMAPSAQATSDTPFNIGEIFNNGASAEEWNQKVDETERLEILIGSYIVFTIGVGFISLILMIKGYFPFEIGFSIIVGDILVGFLIMTFFMPKQRELIKFFVKKRC